MSKVSIREQLGYLKNMTERLGVIHEAQAVQLRNYPRLLPNIKDAETRISPDSRTVVFNCESESKPFRKTKSFKIAMKNVVKWVRIIVWDDTTIELIVNGKSVYDTRIDN